LILSFSGSGCGCDTMDLRIIDPLTDPRWAALTATHPKASVFHQKAWLEALARTYRYKLLAVTSTPLDEPLRDGIALCEVASWITGTRAVSLPFSDHCQPLVSDDVQLSDFLQRLISESAPRHWKYVELRPRWLDGSKQQFSASQSFCFHKLDLTQPIDRLFQNLHRDSIQRKIHRAEREGVRYETGSSELLDDFYGLLLMTRKRHRVPAQPRAWFQNLLQGFGENAQIRIARKDEIPIAAIFTLRHRSSVVYKYGCSDEKWHNLGGMPFLFWKLIEESKASGAEELDFGRSDLDNEGLVMFKDRFGTERTSLTYFRYPCVKETRTAASAWTRRSAGRLFSIVPNALMPAVGRIVYRHIG